MHAHPSSPEASCQMGREIIYAKQQIMLGCVLADTHTCLWDNDRKTRNPGSIRTDCFAVHLSLYGLGEERAIHPRLLSEGWGCAGSRCGGFSAPFVLCQVLLGNEWLLKRTLQPVLWVAWDPWEQPLLSVWSEDSSQMGRAPTPSLVLPPCSLAQKLGTEGNPLACKPRTCRLHRSCEWPVFGASQPPNLLRISLKN